MDEDRAHERRRQDLGARADADREEDGKRPFTDRERDLYVDGLLEREREARQARWRAEDRRARILEQIIGNLTSGVVGGLVLALCLWLAKLAVPWLTAHFHL